MTRHNEVIDDFDLKSQLQNWNQSFETKNTRLARPYKYILDGKTGWLQLRRIINKFNNSEVFSTKNYTYIFFTSFLGRSFL